jgi:tetraacyldisaccharide 4'-kinase
VDGAVGMGNGFCLPAGPLRAPLAEQLPFVDAVLRMDGSAATAMNSLNNSTSALLSSRPLITAVMEPEVQTISHMKGKRLLAFAGIGRPQKFFDTLASAGLQVQETQAFADHHPYTVQDIAALQLRASTGGMTLITTEKDAVRLRVFDQEIMTLPIALRTDVSTLMALLMKAIDRKRSPILQHASK